MQIHEALAKVIKKHCLTGKALAAAAGIGESQLSFFIRGERGLQYESLCRVLDALPPTCHHDLLRLMEGSESNVSVRAAIAALQQHELTDAEVADLLAIASSHVRSAKNANSFAIAG